MEHLCSFEKMKCDRIYKVVFVMKTLEAFAPRDKKGFHYLFLLGMCRGQGQGCGEEWWAWYMF
jgi:hypothetical protein